MALDLWIFFFYVKLWEFIYRVPKEWSRVKRCNNTALIETINNSEMRIISFVFGAHSCVQVEGNTNKIQLICWSFVLRFHWVFCGLDVKTSETYKFRGKTTCKSIIHVDHALVFSFSNAIKPIFVVNENAFEVKYGVKSVDAEKERSFAVLYCSSMHFWSTTTHTQTQTQP